MRKLAGAAFTATLIALAVDVLLQAALGITRGDLQSMRLIAVMFERLRWTVAAALVSAIAPAIDRRFTDTLPSLTLLPTRAAWMVVAVACLAFPPAWEIAMLLIMALRLTMARTWGSGYQLYLEPSFYSDLIVDYAPWLLAGLTLIRWARHSNQGSGIRDQLEH